MTPEQQKHQEEYMIAKKKYENAFAEKRRAENEINNILNRRQQILSSINDMVAERNRNSDSLSQLQNTSAQNSDFEASVRDTDIKLESASQGFLAIGESSVGKPQKLTDVFEERNRTSKSSIASAFEQMKTIGSSIQRKIDDLSRQISQLEQEMEDGKNRESYLNNMIAEQNHIMNNASIEMAYHKNHMND